MSRTEFILGGMLIATLFAGGCGGSKETSPTTVPVTGQIAYQGEPVTSGSITFHPINGGRQASSDIDDNGSFTLSSFGREDGAILGKYKVTIKAYPKGQDVSILPEKEIKYMVPRKYVAKATTPIEVEVNHDSNNFTFVLKD